MKLISSILGETTVIEVEASGGTTSIRTSVAGYSKKERAITPRAIDLEKEDRSKKKGALALLVVAGSDVGSKEYGPPGDEASKKITENENLLWTIHEEEGGSGIDFIRKSSLENVLNEIKGKDFYLADIVISQRADVDIPVAIQHLYEKKLDIGLVKRSKEFRAFFFDSLFDKIKLPLLLIFFVLLLVNYLGYSNLKEKYDISETAYTIQLQRSKLETENNEKANRLFSEYDKVGSYPLALLSDRIASYVPKDVRLTSMEFFPEKVAGARGKTERNTQNVIIVKGKSEIAGTALLFAQYLQEDKLFEKVDIITINNLKDVGLYDFELHIIL